MKFGRQLRERMNPEWKFYYMDYDGLKTQIKERTTSGTFFAERDEASFVEALDREVQKVFDFRDVKGGELTRHVQYCEEAVAKLDFDDKEGVEILEAEIGRITWELAQLTSFTRLNYMGVMKILKKHDKYTEFMLKPMFMVRLNSKPLGLENLDNLVYRLSRLYDRLRNGPGATPASRQANLAEPEGTQIFVRKTTKYWVHPDNVTEVKCAILKHLPVLVFPSRRGIDAAVSSVYLDSEDLELYTGRLQKLEGAVAIRLRWYGSDEPTEIFVERKTHREDWTGEVSVKSRFPLKAKHADAFLRGDYLPGFIERHLQKYGRSEEEAQSAAKLAGELQHTITLKKLRPTLRTFYNRTAFQLPGDATVRISLDTELAMIREDGPDRANNHWHRQDIDCDWPFTDLRDEEISRFPYAILELKLQTQAGAEPPSWVRQLTQSHLVEEVPKFSKYIHGCATLLEPHVNALPFWLPQMAVDIRRLPSKPLDDEISPLDEAESSGEEQGDGESTEHTQSPAPGPSKRTMGLGQSSDHVKINMGQPEKEPLLDRTRQATVSSRLSSWFGRSQMESSLAIPNSNKRISIPVRVEPKVFFANERTFLSWIHFSIFLGGIATALVGLGNRNARISGFIFTAVSVLFAGYALYLYQWRAEKIRQRDPGPYDDRLGPMLVVIVFLIAMAANVIFNIMGE